MLLVFAVQQLSTILTPKSSLIPLNGTLRSCDTYVTSVGSTSKIGYEAKSQKAALIFYLNEHKKKFALVENIGSDYRKEEYEVIKSKLTRAGSVTVWVKKSELDFWEPQVFQIDTEMETVLDFQAVRFKHRPVTAFLLLIGLGCIAFPIYAFYPRPFKKHQSEKQRQPTTAGL
jgi:hypothetical protein